MAASIVPGGYRAANPVTLTEVKEYLRITDTAQDSRLNLLIGMACDYAQTCTGWTIRPTRFQFRLDHFPYGYSTVSPLWPTSDDLARNDSPYYCGDSIILPRFPLYEATEDSDLVSVSYTNTSGGSSALTMGTDFLVDEESRPGRLYLPYNGTWPQTRAIQGAVVIQFSAGCRYGEGADGTSMSLPDGIRQGIILAVAHLYEMRTPVSEKSLQTVPMSIESLFWAERVVTL